MANKKTLTTANSDTPAKPQPSGILLTPGTGTTRRKRVSFGHDVKAGTNGVVDGNVPGVWTSNAESGKTTKAKSKLAQALENSRKNKQPQPSAAGTKPKATEPKDSEDVWEEVDDVDRDPDMTVDINEPHSQSGKYWKSCFERYHSDAKAEMEKLVKYKALAKSYAKMKDSEAMDLNQKLHEEQDKVQRMERRVADMTRQLESSRKRIGHSSKQDGEMTEELARQTAIATEYGQQVQELEELLLAAGQEPDDKGKRKKHVTTSPRTQKTLIETQRELRRARAQVKELGDLRDEVSRLKAEILAEKQKSAKLADENRKLAGDLSRSSSKVVNLEKKLDESRDEARQKDRELRSLKKEHDQLKENAKSRYSEAEQVLARKNETISGLKDEIRSLTTEKGKRQLTTLSDEHRAILDAATRLPDAGRKVDRERPKSYYVSNANRLEDVTGEVATTEIFDSDKTRRRGRATTGPSLRRPSSNIHMDKDAKYADQKPNNYEDETLATSRALRERLTAEMSKTSSSSSALSDRGNLQDLRRTTSTTASNRHSYPSGEVVEPSLPTLPRPGEMGEDDNFGFRRQSSKGSIRHKKASDLRLSSADSDGPQIDLVHSHFAKLGGPEAINTSTVWDINATKTSLPADRRAAAIARLQRKRAERSRIQNGEDRNKENMLP